MVEKKQRDKYINLLPFVLFTHVILFGQVDQINNRLRSEE